MKILLSIWLTLIGFGALAAPDRPNLVFIVADDCTFRDIGCYGGQAHTPHIDALAKEGMRFTRCFQAAPMCSPTRHNIYTGLYPVKSGAYPNHTFAREGTKSIVHYLQPLGYRVALSGKKHISPGTVFPFEYSGKGNNPDLDAIDTLVAECAEQDTPFCLFACSNEPHTPWNKGDPSAYPPEDIVLPPYIADTPVVREQFAKYLAEVTYYDSQVGQILDLLDRHDLRDNTLVMVVSEQGNSLPFAKWTCYEMGLGSIMITRWPGRVKPGAITDAMVEYCDVTPTFVEAAGGTPDPVLDGKSFLPVLTGERSTHKTHTYGIMTTRGINNGSPFYPIRSVRDEQYRLIWNLSSEETFLNACVKSPSFQSMVEAGEAGDKLAQQLTRRYKHRPEFELYDVVKDPMNMTNLAAQPRYAEVVTELKAKLDTWMREQGDRGLETEMDALKHQGRSRKTKKTKKPGKK